MLHLLKKPIFISLALLGLVCTLKAQHIENTKWKANFSLPDSASLLLDFRQDSLYAVLLPDSTVFETMTYTFKDNILSLQKISGESSCDNVAIGRYKLEIRDGKCWATLQSDDCQPRADSFHYEEPWIQIK